MQKQLSGSAKNKATALIGEGVEVIDLQTQITITRTSNEKPIEMVTCNACNCEYQNNAAVYYWHNYGGKPTKKAVCSTDCQEAVLSFLGNRAAKTRDKLTPFRFFK